MMEKTEAGTTIVSIRLDKNLKKDTEILFSAIGMNMTTAINVFLRRCQMENRIPFEIGLRRPNAETIAAIKELDAMEREELPKRVMSIEEVFGKKNKMTFEEIRDIVAPIAAKHGVNRMYLFGSRARGDNRADSDFDFCIDIPKGFSLMDIGGVLSDLKDALGTDVDLVCEEDARKKPHLMEEILRDGKIVFEATFEEAETMKNAEKQKHPPFDMDFVISKMKEAGCRNSEGYTVLPKYYDD